MTETEYTNLYNMVVNIQGHVSTMNRELGELVSRIAMLEKIVFIVLGALVVNVGIAAFRRYKDNKHA